MKRAAWMTPERAAVLREKGPYIIPLTFGRARIVVDEVKNYSYEPEFW